MVVKNSDELEKLILEMLNNNPELSVVRVVEAAGLSKSSETDRKAIRRKLNKLVQDGLLIAKGTTRARIYLLKKPESSDEDIAGLEKQKVFEYISLSPESKSLLNYLAKPITARTPVGYNPEYLNSYVPNVTYYLSTDQREKLLTWGKVENVVRLAGTYARKILNQLLIDLSWNSSRLEGNTYSLLETKRLIELGESATGKAATETQMILNHKNAIEYIVESVDDPKISALQIYSLHALLSENLLGDPSACGRIRQIIVGISGSTYLPPQNPHQITEFFQKFIQKMNLIEDPFEQSLFSIVHLSYLQAFEDVNKRTARLAANISLIRSNLKPLSFIDVNQDAYATALLGVYEKNDISLLRDLYIWAYQRSTHRYSATQQALGEPDVLKLRYRDLIHKIVRTIIQEKLVGSNINSKIKTLLEEQNISENEATRLFQAIEFEIANIHEGNAVRFKIRPSEFQAWKELQE